jgi:hypothetical protein
MACDLGRGTCSEGKSHIEAGVKSADLTPQCAPKIEAGAAVLLRPVLQAYASGRQGLHEVLAHQQFANAKPRGLVHDTIPPLGFHVLAKETGEWGYASRVAQLGGMTHLPRFCEGS